MCRLSYHYQSHHHLQFNQTLNPEPLVFCCCVIQVAFGLPGSLVSLWYSVLTQRSQHPLQQGERMGLRLHLALLALCSQLLFFPGYQVSGGQLGRAKLKVTVEPLFCYAEAQARCQRQGCCLVLLFPQEGSGWESDDEQMGKSVTSRSPKGRPCLLWSWAGGKECKVQSQALGWNADLWLRGLVRPQACSRALGSCAV